MWKFITLLIISALSINSHAQWRVDNNQSKVSFVSVKKDHVAEAHHFTSVSGKYSDDGRFELVIDLNSVTTGIEIRDQRLKEHLFKTKTLANASFSASVPPKIVRALTIGQTVNKTITGTLSLMGHEQQVTALVSITKLAENALLINSAKPVIINAADYGLVAGINKLAQMAKLSRISYAVPVSFVVRLQR